MSEKPLTPWVIVQKSGKVLSAHCNCMAGLGESCSHVASLLWAIEAGSKRRDSLTVTEKKAYWVLPSAVKSVPYEPIKNIKFTKDIMSPSSTAQQLSVNNLKKCSSKPAILSLLLAHSDSYVPKSLNPDLPAVLSSLYDENLRDADFSTVVQKAAEIANSLKITNQQKKIVEEKTRDQANSRLWFRMRSGRITASKFKSACRTNPALPSRSLIMSICHPELARFSTEAISWGCQHERTAKHCYSSFQNQKHKNFIISDSGLFISTDFPYLGASPDGLVECECCGAGACEIKVIKKKK